MPDTSTQHLERLLGEIRLSLQTVPALKRVYTDVPDALNMYPSIVVYPAGFACYLGSHSGEGGNPMFWTVHTIRIELHIPRKDLSRDIALAVAFQQHLPAKLYSAFERNEFGGTMVLPGNPQLAQNSVAAIRGSLLDLGWGSDANIGWRLEFDVTTESEIFV